LGSVLLCAAILKSHQLLTDLLGSGFWLHAIVIQLETLIGLCLLFDLQPHLTRKASLVLFVGFLAYSFHHLVAGASSCACLGKIQVRPWVSLSFDAGAIAALWLWRPLRSPEKISLAAILIIVLPLAAFPFIAWATARPPYPRLMVLPSRDSPVAANKGQRRVLSVTVRNPNDRRVVIDAFESSCPCLRAVSVPVIWEPGTEKTIEFELDLAREPDFSGLLAIAVYGRTASRELAIRAEFVVRVSPPVE
jgi:hypothetical protein